MSGWFNCRYLKLYHRAPRITTAVLEAKLLGLVWKFILRSIKWLKCTKTAIKVYIPHEKLCLCCFLTVSCPISSTLASFNVSVFQLLRRRQGKTRLYYAARKKKVQKLLSFHCNRSQTWVQNEDFPSLNMSICGSKHRAMASRVREMSLKTLNLPRPYNRSSAKWPTDGIALTLLLAQ